MVHGSPSLPPGGVRPQHSSHHKQRLIAQPESGYTHSYSNSRLRPDSPSSDYRHQSTSRPPRSATHPQSQPNLMTGPGMNTEGGVGPLPQPGQLQTYQTHVFAPVVTGAPVKGGKFIGPSGSALGISQVPSGGMSVGPGVRGNSSPNVGGAASEYRRYFFLFFFQITHFDLLSPSRCYCA